MAFATETFCHQRPFHDVRHPHLPRGQTALYGVCGGLCGNAGNADATAGTFTLRLTAVMLVIETGWNCPWYFCDRDFWRGRCDWSIL